MRKPTAADAPAAAPIVAQDAAPSTIVEQQPTRGGSYIRDPATGKLTRAPAEKEG